MTTMTIPFTVPRSETERPSHSINDKKGVIFTAIMFNWVSGFSSKLWLPFLAAYIIQKSPVSLIMWALDLESLGGMLTVSDSRLRACVHAYVRALWMLQCMCSFRIDITQSITQGANTISASQYHYKIHA